MSPCDIYVIKCLCDCKWIQDFVQPVWLQNEQCTTLCNAILLCDWIFSLSHFKMDITKSYCCVTELCLCDWKVNIAQDITVVLLREKGYFYNCWLINTSYTKIICCMISLTLNCCLSQKWLSLNVMNVLLYSKDEGILKTVESSTWSKQKAKQTNKQKAVLNTQNNV